MKNSIYFLIRAELRKQNEIRLSRAKKSPLKVDTTKCQSVIKLICFESSKIIFLADDTHKKRSKSGKFKIEKIFALFKTKKMEEHLPVTRLKSLPKGH